ncbi:MAG: SLC13 family permease [Planctomycetota bacterium]
MPASKGPVIQNGSVLLLLLANLFAGLTGFYEGALGLETPAAIALTIVITAAALWISEAVPLFVTSFILLFLELVWLAPELGLSSTPFTAPFFSNTILLFLGGFVLSSAFRKYLIDERLARWVLTKTGTRPAYALAGILGATAFLSMWMSNTATAAMMISISVPLLRNLKADDPFRYAVMLGIAFSANMGGLGTPIGTPPNAIVMRAMGDKAFGFGEWVLLALPVLLVMLAVLWVLLLRMYPTRVEQLELDEAPEFQWDRASRIVVALSILTALGWLTSDLHGLPSGAVAILPIIVFYGLGLLGAQDFNSMPWNVLMLVGGGMSLGVAVSESGLGDWLVGGVEGVLSFGPVVAMVTVSAVAGIMTAIMSNTATANLLVPVVAALSVAYTPMLLLTIAYSCSLVMVLPVSTPPNAMVFGTGQVPFRTMMIAGGIVSIIGLLLTWTLGSWWWSLLGV